MQDTERTSAFKQVDAALRDDRVRVYYQPLVCLNSGKLVEAEALVRIESPTGDIWTPDQFWETVVDPLFSMRLSDRVLELALQDMHHAGSSVFGSCRCAINVAALQITDKTFGPRLSERLRDNGLRPEQIVLEITETVALAGDNSELNTHIAELSAAGFAIALDDFGTGYASLTHLMELSVSQVKIDKSFMSRALTCKKADAIATTIARLGKSLSLDIVAEGICSPDIKARAVELGCDMGQGYLFAKPMPFEEFVLYAERLPH